MPLTAAIVGLSTVMLRPNCGRKSGGGTSSAALAISARSPPAQNARFAISEAKVGRGAPWAAPLPLLVPPRIAMQLLLTGDPIDAARAHEVGLVNQVVPLADLHDAAQALAERIAANAPLSVRAAKKTVRLVAELPLGSAFDQAEELWAPVYRSADAQEGPAAFRDKRTPVWQGR